MNRAVPRENRLHGNPLYPFASYEVNEISGILFDCHWHEELELLLGIEGCAQLQVGDDEYTLQAGEALFINSGEVHAGYSVGDAPCKVLALVFHPSLLQSSTYDVIQDRYLDPLLKQQYQTPVYLADNEEWKKQIIALIREIARDNRERVPAYELATKAKLSLIFAIVLAHSKRLEGGRSHSRRSHKADRLKHVLQYIHTHYQESIRLKDLAETVNMSEEHFCRFFKQMTKKSPVAYMNHYRMQKAAQLLADTDRKIVEIAMEVGFESISYFISVFKKEFNTTPNQFRKNGSWERSEV
ncbi:AraC family transcriptional regulator [Xylanibacillus composti]|uniref:HTH araC/xylS-type domain-containing protein n=1 Tax=Xylanibacillus composti TaxID=1572762 RepID=A0A8J4H5I0_9BACL|nr:AraC family transcriptional regulator [Xylanibacillus composti]MDT9726514.1 AraC family transcriptional regulator [Xylanibacillus composti]GIQ69912.1 hypothetical protein XYCOK13_27360 [Xylanibacillus composti]